MIGAVFRVPGHLEVGEIGTPKINPDEVLVKVGANTVCGTRQRCTADHTRNRGPREEER